MRKLLIALCACTAMVPAVAHASIDDAAFPLEMRGEWCTSLSANTRVITLTKKESTDYCPFMTIKMFEIGDSKLPCELIKGRIQDDVFHAELSCSSRKDEKHQSNMDLRMRGESVVIVPGGDAAPPLAAAPPPAAPAADILTYRASGIELQMTKGAFDSDDRRAEQLITIKNNSTIGIKSLTAECGFFHGNLLIGRSSDWIHSLAAGQDAYAKITTYVISADHTDCRFGFVER
jgi:hypothetical protein